MKGLDPLSLE